MPALRREYAKQGGFLVIEDFLPAAITAQLIDAVAAVEGSVNRNYLPGHKQGGSVGRHTIDKRAPAIAELYRSTALLQWLEQLTGEPLHFSPPAIRMPMRYISIRAAAITSAGTTTRRTMRAGATRCCLGVIDESSCRLDYELHTREKGAAVVAGSIKIPPGGLVLFDGDALRHRITPLARGETRISLTFEYVTDPQDASLVASHFQHEGRRRLFWFPSGLSALSGAAKSRDEAGGLVAELWHSAVRRGAGLAGTCRRSWQPWRAPAGVCCWSRCFTCCRWCSMRSRSACCSSERSVAATLRDSLLARWVGESANSLMPAGQIGGPVLMARHLAQRGMPMEEAAAAITVSTTLQTFAQIAFALIGVVLLGAQAGRFHRSTLRTSALIASAFLAVQVGGFYLIQRRGLFSKLMRAARRFSEIAIGPNGSSRRRPSILLCKGPTVATDR